MTAALQAIIFDFDGVIADSERLHLLAYQQVLAPHGLRIPEQNYYDRYLGYDDEGVFRSYARDHELVWDQHVIQDLIAAKTAHYEALTKAGEMIYPGAASFLRLAAARVPIAIASGALTHEIAEILDRAALRPLFSTIVGADQTTETKPSPEPYVEAFSRLKARNENIVEWRTVAIEDSRWGLQSAQAAGLRTVAVTNTYTAEALDLYAELVVTGLSDLTLEALDALCATAPPSAHETARASRR